jgi:hypothetical protein
MRPWRSTRIPPKNRLFSFVPTALNIETGT